MDIEHYSGDSASEMEEPLPQTLLVTQTALSTKSSRLAQDDRNASEEDSCVYLPRQFDCRGSSKS